MQEIKLIHGNCYEEVKKIPDKSIDLIYIDIPYLFESGGASDTPLSQRIKKLRNTELENISNGIDYSILDELRRTQEHIYIYIYIYGVVKNNYFRS